MKNFKIVALSNIQKIIINDNNNNNNKNFIFNF